MYGVISAFMVVVATIVAGFSLSGKPEYIGYSILFGVLAAVSAIWDIRGEIKKAAK